MDLLEILVLLRTHSSDWHNNAGRFFRTGIVGLIEQCHSANFSLWHQEDIARRDDLPAEQIRSAKRHIDQLNQQRNDLVEAIDLQLVLELQPPTGDCPFNSETPGMMIDRLSILALKEYHMAEETLREAAGEDHQHECSRKLEIIRQQQDDLLIALTTLITDVRNGTRSFKVYYQFKMYNSKELNPELRAASLLMDDKKALEIRREWMTIMGCGQEEIDEWCDASKSADLYDELEQLEAAKRLCEINDRQQNLIKY